MTKSRLIKIFLKELKLRGVLANPSFATCKLHKIYNDQDWIRVGPKAIEYMSGFTYACYKLKPEEYNNLKQYF